MASIDDLRRPGVSSSSSGRTATPGMRSSDTKTRLRRVDGFNLVKAKGTRSYVVDSHVYPQFYNTSCVRQSANTRRDMLCVPTTVSCML